MSTLRTVLLISIAFLNYSAAFSDALDPQVLSLKKPLGLTENQTQKLSRIFNESQNKIQAIRKQLKEVNMEKQAQINTVLSEEQKKKYTAILTPNYPKESEPQLPQMTPMGTDTELQ